MDVSCSWRFDETPIRSDYAVNDMAQHLPTVIPAKAGIQNIRSASKGGIGTNSYKIPSQSECTEKCDDV